MKIYILLVFSLFYGLSFSQITREQANEIVRNYIVDEGLRTDCLLLFTTDKLPDAEGISTITNSNNETFSIEYPSWVYFINEWMDVNGPYFRRYLFVNKADGNILEIKTRKDLGPSDIAENWELIYSAANNFSDIDNDSVLSYYLNPKNNFLEITSQIDFEYIVIFDLQGKQVFQEISKKHKTTQEFDISILNNGIYIVSVFSENKKMLSFKIQK